MTPAQTTLALNASTLRAAYGWSRREVCRRTGLGHRVIQGVEGHPFERYDVRLSSLARLAEAYRLGAAELLYDSDTLQAFLGPPRPTDGEGCLPAPPPEPTRAYSLAVLANLRHSLRAAVAVLRLAPP